MNCESYQSRLIEFEHDELDPTTRAEVSRHLAHCPACALESCRLRADLEGIASAHAEAPGPEVREALRRRVERAVRLRWWGRLVHALERPIPVYAAAAAAVVPLVLWGVIAWSSAARTSQPPPTAPTIVDYDGANTRLNAPHVL